MNVLRREDRVKMSTAPSMTWRAWPVHPISWLGIILIICHTHGARDKYRRVFTFHEMTNLTMKIKHKNVFHNEYKATYFIPDKGDKTATCTVGSWCEDRFYVSAYTIKNYQYCILEFSVKTRHFLRERTWFDLRICRAIRLQLVIITIKLNDIAPIKPNSWSESGYPQYEIGLIGRPSGLVLYNPLDSPAKYCRKEEWCNGKIRFSSTPTKRSTKFALTIEVNVKTLDTTSPDVITAVRFKQGNFSLGVYRLEFFTPPSEVEIRGTIVSSELVGTPGVAEERFVAFVIPIKWTWDLHDYIYLFKENSTTAVRCKTVETIEKDAGFQWSYYSGPRYTKYTDHHYKMVTEPYRNAILLLPISENAGNLQYTVYFYDSLSPRRYEAYELLSEKRVELLSRKTENKTNKTLLGATAVEPDQPADMSAIAVGTGLVASAVTLMLAAVVVCLVRSRRLQQEQAIALRYLKTRMSGANEEELSENRESGVYVEPGDKERDYESLPGEDVSFECDGARSRPVGDSPRYVYLDKHESTVEQRVQHQLPETPSEYSRSLLRGDKSCSLGESNLRGAYSDGDLYLRPFRPRPNSCPGFNERGQFISTSGGPNTPYTHYNRLQADSTEETGYKNCASSSDATEAKTVFPAEESENSNGAQNEAANSKESVSRRGKDGDYLTVLDLDEEPVIYLDLDEEPLDLNEENLDLNEENLEPKGENPDLNGENLDPNEGKLTHE